MPREISPACHAKQREGGWTNPTQRVDLEGQRFGRLIVLGPAPQQGTVAKKARWLCQCECGQTAIVRTDYLRVGRAVSCGCWRKRTRLLNQGAAWGQVFNRIRANAHSREIVWDLTRADVVALCSQPCHFCAIPPSQVRKTKQDAVLYNGIDRLDSLKGYVADNVVPCCKACNFAKNVMTVEEFRTWLTRAYRHFCEVP